MYYSSDISIRSAIAIWAGRLASNLARIFDFGAGVTWAGEVASWIQPNLLSELSKLIDHSILVSGTNGKTTTAAMTAYLIEQKNYTVIHNKTGANLQNGILGTFITQLGKFSTRAKTLAVLEVDEAELPNAVDDISPDVVILLNLFRDQLDRYGEINTISQKWKAAFEKQEAKYPKKTTYVVIADDPLVYYSVQEITGASIRLFGMTGVGVKSLDAWADSTSCPRCGSSPLDYSAHYYSHLGNWSCSSCSLTRPVLTLSASDIPLSLLGMYNKYNASASLLAASAVGLHPEIDALKKFDPVFGRQEVFEINGIRAQMLLSKNPTGFNESIRTILDQDDIGAVLLALNDRTPDGTDVSWIWDVDFSQLTSASIPLICTGDRVWDLALRIKYTLANDISSNSASEKNHMRVKPDKLLLTETNAVIEPDVQSAIEIGVQKVSPSNTLYILPTYSAMLSIRKSITGRKIP